jgi:hypothetical protein
VAAWHDFYVMAGGAIAALTGLLFVAMSIHLKEILAKPNLTRNVAVSLYGMLSQLLFCGFMLVPGLTPQVAGVVVIMIGLSFTLGYLRFGRPRGPFDSISNTVMGLLGVLVGLLLMIGITEALFAYAVILGVAVFALVRLCWLLLTMAITGLDNQRLAA